MSPRRLACLLAVSTCLFVGQAGAAPAGAVDFKYRGYLQYSATYDALDHESVLNPGNLLGLSSHRSRATADINFSAASESLRAVAEGYGYLNFEGSDSDLDLYQGYVSWSSPDQEYFLRAGRAVLGWGAGQIWNPVRAITNETRTDLIFPDQAVDGIDLLEARAFVRGATVTLLALAPKNSRDRWGYTLRYADNVGQLDYAASLYSDLRGRRRIGGELSLPMGRITLVGEAVLTHGNQNAQRERAGAIAGNDSTLSYVLGANVVLPRDVIFITEYYRDGTAMDSSQVRRFRAGLPEGAERYNVFGNGHDNLYLGLNQQLTWRDSSLSLGAFVNRESRSSLLQARFEGQLATLARLQLSYIEYLEYAGGEDIAYLDRSVEALVRFSF